MLYTARRSRRTGSGVTHCCHRARVAGSGLCSGPTLTGLGASLERERDNIMLGVRSNPHGECAAPAHPPTLLPSSGKPVSISVGRKRGSGSCSISQHGRHGTAARYLPWNHAPFGDWRLPFPALSAAHLPDMSVLACVPNGSSCPSPLTRCFRNRCRADTARR